MILKWPYKIVRSIVVTLAVTLAVVPMLLYVALSLPPVQRIIKDVTQSELTKLLGAPVEIGSVNISPFTAVAMKQVTVTDSLGEPALRVKFLGAGIDIMKLLRGDIVVTYADVDGLDLNVYRATPSSPLNIQPIIDHLSPKDKNKPPTRFDLAIKNVVIRNSRAGYNVLNAPAAADGRFDPRHVEIKNLEADVKIPRLSNDRYEIELEKLAVDERSGFSVTGLSALAVITPDAVDISNFSLSLPHSSLTLAPTSIDLAKLKDDIMTLPVSLTLARGTTITPADLKAFLPRLSQLTTPVSIVADVHGTPRDLDISALEVDIPDVLWLQTAGRVIDPQKGFADMELSVPTLNVRANAPRAMAIAKQFITPSATLDNIANGLGDVEIVLSGETVGGTINAQGGINASPGSIDFEGSVVTAGVRAVKAHVFTQAFDVKRIIPSLEAFAPVGCDLNIDAIDGTELTRQASINGSINNLSLKGYTYSSIVTDVTLMGRNVEGTLNIDDINARASLTAKASLDPSLMSIDAHATIDNINAHALGLLHGYAGYSAEGNADINLAGTSIDNVAGSVVLHGLAVHRPDGATDIRPGDIAITAVTGEDAARHITLDSDIIDGRIDGHFTVAGVTSTVKNILARVAPEAINFPASAVATDDDLAFRFSVKTESPLLSLVNLPVIPLVPVEINGSVNGSSQLLSLYLSAPYLQQKNKLIENTALSIDLDGNEARSSLAATSLLPVKGGLLALDVTGNSLDGRLDSSISWHTESGMAHGEVKFSTAMERDSDDGSPIVNIDINPGRIVFNDTVWTINPSQVTFARKQLLVNDFKISHRQQLVSINGSASSSPDDQLVLRLRDINLDYIFETLNIGNVAFGGDATGTFYASNLFSGAPVAYTDNLHVKNLSYNGCVMGDGDIASAWHPERQDISIDAVILQKDGNKSMINGTINPVKELLDFRFDAHRAPVGFLKPFMAAFCDGISGYASGKAHLYGTFKLLDMTGDIYGENLKMDIGFTNTSYFATDSVHIQPGRIELDNIKITDNRGHSARLGGLLTHESFKNPVFKFTISEANDLLCYDIKPNSEHPWYGKVYGSGNVTISGYPGMVDIGVNMTTTAGTDFSFVLSDSEVAADYNFITFRDKTPARTDTTAIADDGIPAIVKALRHRVSQQSVDQPTRYAMTFNIDITPDAKVNLIMDPAAGDRIRATGSGNLRMSYDSSNEDLKMYGTYTLQRGSYNFTFQEIIIKDFTIRDGSSITFHGDPYSAQLDISAYYSLNANLSDLDESFSQDRELNRTNVPVHALLLVTGDMRSPDIAFDLEFPTLTQDTYRKVRSIISTDDMMNRQIIYLLALNRFYTPEYISATRGNELVSVASSTISSQLSSILGQLSDKFSIAPTFRSDRGDFSDVEFDVALSSALFNNRLLFNGNLGYRDKSLNQNSFIGDFDIEYLLNRSGSFRLKAYNRYNDQNYYLKSALTTQGVGIVWKKDFDKLFNFLKPRRRSPAMPVDSLIITPADTTVTTK